MLGTRGGLKTRYRVVDARCSGCRRKLARSHLRDLELRAVSLCSPNGPTGRPWNRKCRFAVADRSSRSTRIPFSHRGYIALQLLFIPRDQPPLWIYGAPSPFSMQSFISAMVFPNVGQPGSVSRINIILVEYSIRRTRRIFPGERGIRPRIFISSRDAVVTAFRETSLREVPWDRRWTLAVSPRRCTLTTDATISFMHRSDGNLVQISRATGIQPSTETNSSVRTCRLLEISFRVSSLLSVYDFSLRSSNLTVSCFMKTL